ncbi:uncharacterized protein LOC121431706 [Lytechinus variegatus]|uniref:uncharacterized protein LOC121431706 n=1 Tax=Lytechinus variegatus TaxID=7654 RepID=UPI001BB16504|nr:uncharacterized protein LOC121431706 [Lytechinus variegatus]
MAPALIQFLPIIISFFIWLMTLHNGYCDNTTFRFIDGPRTDEACYVEGMNAKYTAVFAVGGSIPLTRFEVWLNTDPEGNGFWKTNGTQVLFYQDSQSEDNSRFRITADYDTSKRIVTYNLYATSLALADLTHPMYACIVDKQSGDIVKISTNGTNFNVEKACPTRSPNQATPQIASEWSLLGAVVAIMVLMIH